MKKLFSILSLAAVTASSAVFAEGEAAPSGGSSSMFIMLGLAVLAFYFIILRPERKRRKQMEATRNSMKKGDKVTAAMGIRGTIHKIQEDSIIMKLYDGAQMEILKAAISTVEPANAEPEIVS